VSEPPSLELVNLAVADGVGTIELNRPDSLNAWNHPFAEDLLAAQRWCEASAEVRALVVTGAGRAFSSGADLRDTTGRDLTPAGRPNVYKTLTERYHPVLTGVRLMPKPVIAAVNGPAVGIGASLALCCDLILAGEGSYFLFAFVNVGLVPDGGSSFLLPTRIGMARSAELAMLGERLPAARALDWGLVNRVLPDAELATEAHALAARMAQGATLSYAGTKRQMNAWLYERMEAQLDLEARIQQEMAESEDFLEGVMAFAERRPARFQGR
jgi:2-(1,2-epoxy-1,2-dihydrophenyl)acetyl-CoA isomerase